MKSVYQIIRTNDELFSKLNRSCPGMVEFSKTVEVIPWQDEFDVTGDTGAVGFANTKKVSFRSPDPSFYTVIHELGHVYFEEPDQIWSDLYGGGEGLLWLWLERHMFTTEQAIKTFHQYKRRATDDPESVASDLCNQIFSKLDLPAQPRLYCLRLLAGETPGEMGITRSRFLSDLKNPRWPGWLHTIPVDGKEVDEFLASLLFELRMQNPWYIKYAVALGLIQECTVCGAIPCTCYQNKIVTIRLSSLELAAIQEAAHEEGKSVEAYIRDQVLARLPLGVRVRTNMDFRAGKLKPIE